MKLLGEGVATRTVALDVLQRVSAGAWSNVVLPAAITEAKLDPRDAAAVTAMVNETIRRRRRWDSEIAAAVDRPLTKLDPEVLEACRLGVAQAHGLDVEPHAAVWTTVEALRPRRGSSLVNAVLRRALDRPLPVPNPQEDPLGHWGMATGLPDWILRICREVAPTRWTELATSLTQPAPICARISTESADRVESTPHPWVRRSHVLARRPDTLPPGVWIQDAASTEVVNVLMADAPDRVIDLCAGPGGKTIACVEAGARVDAVEPVKSRADSVLRAISRANAGDRVELHITDGRQIQLEPAPAVLVDAPCSGLGTLRRRPEIAHRATPDKVTEFAVLQRELLNNAATMVAPDGVLVYSVCTFTPQETTAIADGFDSQNPGTGTFERVSARQLAPDTDACDGMFIAKWRRTS